MHALIFSPLSLTNYHQQLNILILPLTNNNNQKKIINHNLTNKKKLVMIKKISFKTKIPSLILKKLTGLLKKVNIEGLRNSLRLLRISVAEGPVYGGGEYSKAGILGVEMTSFSGEMTSAFAVA